MLVMDQLTKLLNNQLKTFYIEKSQVFLFIIDNLEVVVCNTYSFDKFLNKSEKFFPKVSCSLSYKICYLKQLYRNKVFRTIEYSIQQQTTNIWVSFNWKNLQIRNKNRFIWLVYERLIRVIYIYIKFFNRNIVCVLNKITMFLLNYLSKVIV